MPHLIQVTSHGPMLLNIDHISAIFPKTPLGEGSCEKFSACIIMGSHTYYVLESMEEILIKIDKETDL